MLSDIRNRIGASVILFHHRQVSPALIATAHHNIDFDYFCSQIPIAAPLYEADNIGLFPFNLQIQIQVIYLCFVVTSHLFNHFKLAKHLY